MGCEGSGMTLWLNASQEDNDVCVSGRHCLVDVGKDLMGTTRSLKLANIRHGKVADLFL